MNNSITENNKKRYLPHDINTRKYAVEMYRKQIMYVENTIFQGFHYGDRIKNIIPKRIQEKNGKRMLNMYQMNVRVAKYQRIKNSINTHIQMKQQEKDI